MIKKRFLAVTILVLMFVAQIASATVSSTVTPRKEYDGNGVTVNFPITFAYEVSSDVVVLHTDATGTETTWTEDGAGDTGYTVSSSTVTANTAPATGTTLLLYREVPLTQTLNLRQNRRFNAETEENSFDKLTLAVQDNNEKIGRALKFPISSNYSDLPLPDPVAGKFIRWNAALTAMENASLGTVGLNLPVLQLSDYANLAAFVAAVGSTDVELWVDVSETISATVTTNANTTIRFINGFIFTDDASNADLNILGPIIAVGDQQLFNWGNGSGSVSLPLFYLNWFGAGQGVSADDIVAMTQALATGGKIVGVRDADYDFGTDQWIVTSGMSTHIDWNGANISTSVEYTSGDYIDEAADNYVFLFSGTVATLLENVVVENGVWAGIDLNVHAYKFVRCKNHTIRNNHVTAMLLAFDTHHPDAPMAAAGTTRPDVTEDLSGYINYGATVRDNVIMGDDGGDYVGDAIDGTAAIKMRWSYDWLVENNYIEYCRQGITWKGGASDQDDDGEIIDGDGDPRVYWSRGKVVSNTVKFITKGGIWGNNGDIISVGNYAERCGDFGLHPEGGIFVDTASEIRDCANGIGHFSFGKSTVYVGTRVILNDSTIFTNSHLFKHTNNTSGDTGTGKLIGVTFINNDPTIVGLITFQRDHVWSMENCEGDNVKIVAAGTNHGKRFIEGVKLRYTNSDITGLAAFIAIEVGGIVTDGDDVARINSNTIDASEVTLPAGCTAIHAYGGSAIAIEIDHNAIYGTWEREITYADTAGGGNKNFQITNNALEQGNIYCVSEGYYSANAHVSGNYIHTTAQPAWAAEPVFGAYAPGAFERYSAPASGDYMGWVCTGVGAAVKEVYNAANTYSKYECVEGSDGAAYWAKTDLTAHVDNDPVTGVSPTTKWGKYETAIGVFKEWGGIT